MRPDSGQSLYMDDILDAAQKKSEDNAPQQGATGTPPASPPPVDLIPVSDKSTQTPLLNDPPVLSSPSPATPPLPEEATEKPPETKPDDTSFVLKPDDSLKELTPNPLPESSKPDEAKIISSKTEEEKPPDGENAGPNEVFSVPPASPKKPRRGRGVLIATVLFFILTLPIAVYFISNPQQLADLRQRAAIINPGCGPYGCPTPTTFQPECGPGSNAACREGTHCDNGVCQPNPPECGPGSGGPGEAVACGRGFDCVNGKCVVAPECGQVGPGENVACRTGFQCVNGKCVVANTPTTAPNGYPCCGGSYGATCGSDETCRVDNGACPGSGKSCGKNACTANGTACTGATAGNCCSGLCANNVCVSGNGGGACRSAAQVCTAEGGSAGGAIACASGGAPCTIGGAVNCCYADASTACSQNPPVHDGACYTGQGGCAGGSFTNNTGRTLTVSKYTRTSGGCPSTQFAGTSQLAPGGEVTADDCEQFDVAGFCGYCNPSCGRTEGTPNPTPTGVLAQCLRIKIYKNNQVVTDLTTLHSGDSVVLSVAGSNATKGRIRVNGAAFTETTTKNSAGEFTVPFTLPASITSFTVEAEIFNGTWQ